MSKAFFAQCMQRGKQFIVTPCSFSGFVPINYQLDYNIYDWLFQTVAATSRLNGRCFCVVGAY